MFIRWFCFFWERSSCFFWGRCSAYDCFSGSDLYGWSLFFERDVPAYEGPPCFCFLSLAFFWETCTAVSVSYDTAFLAFLRDLYGGFSLLCFRDVYMYYFDFWERFVQVRRDTCYYYNSDTAIGFAIRYGY